MAGGAGSARPGLEPKAIRGHRLAADLLLDGYGKIDYRPWPARPVVLHGIVFVPTRPRGFAFVVRLRIPLNPSEFSSRVIREIERCDTCELSRIAAAPRGDGRGRGRRTHGHEHSRRSLAARVIVR